ncbi:T9SS type A sorting domain-containing protein [Pollutibacter soli]|uniref:Ig-like domain-containing protein n=1 Tax=Pollutibacter soli TaxID=3034157 RepID=UPI003013B524
MKAPVSLTLDKKGRFFLLFFFLCSFLTSIKAQVTPASRSFIVGIGRTSCTGSTIGVETFSYNQTTNLLTNVNLCTPNLTPAFSDSRAVIDYNPKDQKLYYFRRVLVGSVYNTHVWSWAPGTCPSTSPAYKSIDTFLNAYLTVAFDRDGIGWMVDLVAQTSPAGTFGLRMRKVDFSTGVISTPDTIFMPAGVRIYAQSGDYLITPTGTMFFAYNNKLFTIDYQNFGTGTMKATYIDTIALPVANQNLIGLAYASGEFLGSFVRSSSPLCGYSEVGLLNGNRAAITYAGTFASYDATSVTSSVGVSKNLISVTSTGTPNQYDVAYNIRVSNLGNYPISNTQVIDSLQYINGVGNVVSASASFIDNPGGLVLNPSYDGTTNANLLAANQTLKNYPVSQNYAVIRVNVRLNNIVQGQVYNNAAVASGIGYSGLAIRDSSTNGGSPDLNLNEKADDPGENLTTPFVVTVANESPACATITTLLLNQTFGTGTGLTTTFASPGLGSSGYTGVTTSPIATDRFTITNNPNNANASHFLSMVDHTGDANGRMLVVNADISPTVVYTRNISNLCGGLKYSFKAWVSNISNQTQRDFCNAIGGFKNPKLLFRVRDQSSGLVLSTTTTADITSSAWTAQGMQFTLPTSANVILEIINQGEGGCGNDLAIDDIQFGLCDPEPSVTLNNASAGCPGSSTTLTATLNNGSVISGTPQYQWQSSTNNSTWSNLASGTNSTYTIANMTSANAIYYRVIVASAGNINNVNCRYISNSFLLNLKTTSTAPTSILASTINSCIGDDVTLTVNGGSLGTNAVWRWYRSSCGGALVGTGPSIIVAPSDTTTYYVRAEGDCNITACASQVINVDDCVVLPFTVLDINGTVEDRANRLRFSLLIDEPLNGLDILKSSDGTNFETIATLHPDVSANVITPIEFADTKIDSRDGIFHYRARIRGINGKVKESQTLVLRRRDALVGSFRVVPNPASVSVTVIANSTVKERAELRIYDQSGRIVYQSNPILQQGTNPISITNLNHIPNGVYYLSLKSATQNQKTKLMIRH